MTDRVKLKSKLFYGRQLLETLLQRTVRSQLDWGDSHCAVLVI